MPKVTYIADDGTQMIVELPSQENLMRGALYNGVEGIVGECGGAPSCATCHVYVDAGWMDKVGQPGETERELLEAAASPVKPNSRLSCQIVMTGALDGLVVRMPARQY